MVMRGAQIWYLRIVRASGMAYAPQESTERVAESREAENKWDEAFDWKIQTKGKSAGKACSVLQHMLFHCSLHPLAGNLTSWWKMSIIFLNLTAFCFVFIC